MRVYISGPMRGYPEFNYPAFNAAAQRWRAAKLIRVPESMFASAFTFVTADARHYNPALLPREDIEVLNPAENFGGESSRDYKEYMKLDFQHVLNSDAIALLPGWEKSEGATKELLVAQTIGLKVYDAETFQRIAPPKMIAVPQAYYNEVLFL